MIPVSGYPNYLVFYLVMPESIHVLYVVHGARNLVRFFAETPRS